MGKHKLNQQRTGVNKPAAPFFRLPSSVRKWGEALLDQQMWCWGCDVRRKSGNLLLVYGFEQRPSPNPRHHSAYTVCLCPDCTLTLWGWGLWIAAQGFGSVILSRSRFRVCYTAEVEYCPQAWQVNNLPPVKSPSDSAERGHTLELLSEALTWIAHYEGWLASQVEPNYRDEVIAAWPQRRRYRGGTMGSDMTTTWKTLAELVRDEMHHGE
jgi:hypothetical protein